MNKRQNSFLQMCASVKVTVNAHQTAWSAYPAFASPYSVFLSSLAATDMAIALQKKQSIGTTEQKNSLRKELNAKLNELTNFLVLYSLITNDSDLKRDVYMSPTGITRLTEKALVGHATKLLALFPNPLPIFLNHTLDSIDTAFISNLETLIHDFTQAIGTPRHIIAERMKGTQELEKNIQLLREKLDQMDIAANVLQYTQAAFYSEYTTSRVLVDRGKRKG